MYVTLPKRAVVFQGIAAATLCQIKWWRYTYSKHNFGVGNLVDHSKYSDSKRSTRSTTWPYKSVARRSRHPSAFLLRMTLVPSGMLSSRSRRVPEGHPPAKQRLDLCRWRVARAYPYGGVRGGFPRVATPLRLSVWGGDRREPPATLSHSV